MNEPILHHYALSPYSEKIRLAFGLKRMTWRSLEVPWILPRPHTLPLTGGYRRIPILQIGADIYCDTRLIAHELERRYPDPPLFDADTRGLADALGAWAASSFFKAASVLVIGSLGDQWPESFRKDREAMAGSRFHLEKMKALMPAMREQYRCQLAWIEQQLSDGRPWLLGPGAGWADLNAYYNCWFVQRNCPREAGLFEAVPRLGDWMERVAAIGHGRPEPMEGEQALEIARQSRPCTGIRTDPHEPNGLKPGDRVRVSADDYGTEPVIGELVSSSAQHISLRQESAQAGEVVIHFPRIGFYVARAR